MVSLVAVATSWMLSVSMFSLSMQLTVHVTLKRNNYVCDILRVATLIVVVIILSLWRMRKRDISSIEFHLDAC